MWFLNNTIIKSVDKVSSGTSVASGASVASADNIVKKKTVSITKRKSPNQTAKTGTTFDAIINSGANGVVAVEPVGIISDELNDNPKVLVEKSPIFESGVLLTNKKKKPFVIVHQYNRRSDLKLNALNF